MPKQSAGLMMYRKREGHIETFLVHLGGPYWTQKVVIVDAGSAPAEIDRALT
jgi:predicted NUDIX family NTP pyrophosphohydrolase